ncbi:polysaccharide biosynthesis protein [Flagellimonas sp. GZD32]|uniref:polysaccharide biosynthesis protein n=1 Tax=Flagellimonas cixiensis TaxID=3228750 RepID=UPI0035C8AA60
MIRNYLKNNAPGYASKWLVLSLDLIIVTLSFILSYLIRFNLTLDFNIKMLIVQIPVVVLLSLLVFLSVGSYKGVIRHTGVRDVYQIFNAVCLTSIATIFVVILIKQLTTGLNFTIPLSIIIIHSLISFLSLTASRYIFKSIYHYLTREVENSKKVLIYGAGESGVIAYNVLTNHTSSYAKVVGYLDDDTKKIGKMINGVRVFERNALDDHFIKTRAISEIIVAIHNIDPNKLRAIVESMVDFPVQVKIVPPVENWINGEFKISQIKNVQIEDLLNRPPIEIKKSKVNEELKNRVIMVTGGAGSIGGEIARQIATYDHRNLILVDQSESALYDLQQELKQNGHDNFVSLVADIRDKNRMQKIFQDYKPDVVFHAAAYKHVPLMEIQPYEAVRINIIGTKTIADLCVENDVKKFVFVSTDKAVNPTNVMGATKRIAEMYINCKHQEGKTKFITTRFGNVLGSNGSVIPLFKKQIENGGPLTVTHKDITRFFMTIPEASQLVLEAGAMGSGGEIFIFDMGESVKIFDLAKNMIKLSGLRYPEDIDIKITGLRPGEKLYEELLANGENTLPTYNKKILISKTRDINYEYVCSKLDELCIANLFLEKQDVIKIMKQIVPEYISNNSEFCEFDKINQEKSIAKQPQNQL